jgi:DNA primase
MPVPKEIFDRIRERVDIVEVVGRYVTLRRAGNGMVGLCPFHQEKTPSFNVVPHKRMFYCFGCGEGGDAIRFVAKLRGISYTEAARELGNEVGIRVEERELSPEEQKRVRARQGLHETMEEAASFYRAVLMVRPEGSPGREYLKKRGITAATVERFRLGYAPSGWTPCLDHLQAKGFTPDTLQRAGLARPSDRGGYDVFRERVMFPILDGQDRVVSFGGRLVAEASADPGGESKAPKYLNGPETDVYSKSSVLFGLTQARSAIQRNDRVLLVEGYFDVISLSQAGFEETVATCGTALTPTHAELVRRLCHNAVALFDADEAGQRAAVRSLPIFADTGIEVLRLQIEGAKDPDEFIQKNGAEAFSKSLERAVPLMEAVIRWTAERFGSTPGGRQRAVEQLGPLIARFPEVARASWTRRVADLFSLPEAAVARQVRSGGAQPVRAADETPASSLSAAPLSREIRHLFWLLVHHGDMAVPRVSLVDPELVSNRLDVRDAVGALLSGSDVARIVAELPQGDLKRLLCEVSAQDGLYEETRVEAAIRHVLAALEEARIRELLAQIHQELSACEPTGDKARSDDLNRRRYALDQRWHEIKAIRRGATS